eukprot:6840267-Alexandrium_andersonii.AAC.1
MPRDSHVLYERSAIACMCSERTRAAHEAKTVLGSTAEIKLNAGRALFCTPLLGVRLSEVSLPARQAGLIRALTTPGGAST